jgi:hypothetical protein
MSASGRYVPSTIFVNERLLVAFGHVKAFGRNAPWQFIRGAQAIQQVRSRPFHPGLPVLAACPVEAIALTTTERSAANTA